MWSQFSLGPLTIHTYALCLLAGIVAAAWITDRRLRARGAAPGIAVDIAMWAVPIGIVGARIYHVLTHLDDFTGPGVDAWAWVRIWEGGNALFGSLLGGAVGVWIGCRISGLRFWSFADALAPGLLVAQAIGRLGNYVNQELFGVPTTLPWGLEIRSDAPMFPAGTPEGTLFHPLFLYEMIWNLIGVAVLLLIERRVVRRNEALLADGGTPGAGLRWGRLFGLYLIWYGLGRSWLEFSIRIDPTSDAPLGSPRTSGRRGSRSCSVSRSSWCRAAGTRSPSRRSTCRAASPSPRTPRARPPGMPTRPRPRRSRRSPRPPRRRPPTRTRAPWTRPGASSPVGICAAGWVTET